VKILDRYILITYLKTFFSVFIILILIFILQTIWLYIRELSGKDLDPIIIAKFLVYFMPKLIPLVLPLTVLLASIMVFGNFAENYEFAAMKSTGISLQRAMSGLSIFIVGLGIFTFFFANNAIPWAEVNSYNLRRNIAKLKPAAFIASGQFNQLGEDFNIKVESKSGDRDQYLQNVTIHKSTAKKGKHSTIISKTGELIANENSNVLQLVLYDGYYYEDRYPKTPNDRNKKPFIKSSFKKYITNIDLSDFNDVDFDEKSHTDKYSMLSVSGLNKTIDSLIEKRQKEHSKFSESLFKKTNFTITTTKKKTDTLTTDALTTKKDSVYNGYILDLFNSKQKEQILKSTLQGITSSKQTVDRKIGQIKSSKTWFNKHIISFHEKFALGFACIILFFVGAPLGALIRKGGIGLPMVIAILLFLTYHFVGIFATNSAKNGEFNPILASWFSTLLMFPLSIYLTRRATADKSLFEGEGVFEYLKKLFKIKKKIPKLDTSTFNTSDSEFDVLNSYDDKKLTNIVKNHKEFGYKVIFRNTALAILNNRGVTDEQLKFSDNFNNREYEQIINLKNKFEEDGKLTFILYIIALIVSLLGAILENNKFPKIGNSLLIIGFLFQLLLVISYIKTCINQYNYRKLTGKNINVNIILMYLLGIPLYFIVYFFQKKELEKDLDLGIENDS